MAIDSAKPRLQDTLTEKVTVRVTPRMHSQIRVLAAVRGTKIQSFLHELLETVIDSNGDVIPECLRVSPQSN